MLPVVSEVPRCVIHLRHLSLDVPVAVRYVRQPVCRYPCPLLQGGLLYLLARACLRAVIDRRAVTPTIVLEPPVCPTPIQRGSQASPACHSRMPRPSPDC